MQNSSVSKAFGRQSYSPAATEAKARLSLFGLALQVSRFSLAKQLILWEAAGKRETQLLEKGTPRNTLEAG